MNDFKRLKSSIKISSVISWEGYEIQKESSYQYKMKCFHHDDNNPSLIINDTKWIFRCFVCNWIWGDVFDFLSLVRPDIQKWKEQINYIEKKYFGKNVPDITYLEPEKQENYQSDEDFQNIMKYIALYWSKKLPKEILDTYLTSSKSISYRLYNWEIMKMQWYCLSREIIDEFMIGFSPNNSELYKELQKRYPQELINKTQLFDSRWLPKFRGRITLPYIVDRKVVCFTSRQTEFTPCTQYDTAKYIHQKIDNIHLYNQDDIQSSCVFIMEWYFDWLALKNIWYNSISLWGFGRSKLERHYNTLQKATLVYVCFDNDEAWNKHAQILHKELREKWINTHIVELPREACQKSIDTNEYLGTHSKEDFNSLLSF